MKFLQDLVPGCNKLLQSRESLSQAMYQLNSSVSAFHYGHQGEGTPVQREISNRTETQSSMNPLGPTRAVFVTSNLPPQDGFGEAAAHFANFGEDDLQSVVQMGFNQNQVSKDGSPDNLFFLYMLIVYS
ncbi:hypothetical protein AQUCO_04800035v1 [Aquilegia coerulea]|uniref:Uncharacterized protein n=1 Tax=Aquilegia coerulea TaxID=218851 RepID=A0A2G5CKK8_AQUCA|nr:hypothetical protein AQUCO_04800035v1 [Aquilegia coerulea]